MIRERQRVLQVIREREKEMAYIESHKLKVGVFAVQPSLRNHTMECKWKMEND